MNVVAFEPRPKVLVKTISMGFTEANVLKLTPPPGKPDITIWDKDLAGFGIRFRNGGDGRYLIQYYVNGRQGRKTYDKVGKISLEAARRFAKLDFALIADKKDPTLEKAREVAEAGDRFGEKVDAYLEEIKTRGLSKAYVDDHERCLKRYLKRLHGHRLGDITVALMAKELDMIAKKNGRRQAGNARTFADGLYKWAAKKGYEGMNPVTATERRPSKRRSRVLEPNELKAIWKATNGDDDFDKIVRLLMLTATRRNQIGWLKRSELNLEKGLIEFVPAHVRAERGEEIDEDDAGKTKNKERFVLPLCETAKAILESVPVRPKSDYVFGEGEGGFGGWTRGKDRLDEKLGDKVRNWTFHDLRRSFDSLGVDEAGIDDRVTDICLHHVGEHRKGVKRNYNHAKYVAKKRDAFKKWEEYLLGIVK